MANAKELKALITLSGKIDPSLQQALLTASNKTRKLSQEMGLVQLASKSAMSKMKSGIVGAIPSLGTLGGKIVKTQKSMEELASKNSIVKAGLVSLQRAGGTSMNVLKMGAKAAAVGFAAMAAVGVAALLAVGSTGLSAATDLAEVQNVVDVTFGQSAGTVDNWSKSLLNAYGLGELSAKKYTSTMGAMLKSSGIASEDMMTMSQNLTMLTGDMASFHNLQPDEMFEKLRSGISGETEPLKQLGINMSAANLEAFALSQGIEASYSSMNEADKTMLRYNYILDATKDSQGDFARTSDSLSNQQKLLKENFTQISAKMMQGVMPALAQGAQMVNQLMSSMDTSVISGFMTQIVDLGVSLMPMVTQLLPVMQSIISTIVPPLVQIVQTILPPVVSLISQLAASLMPMVAQLLPPIQELISAIIPPLMTLINLILPPITAFLGFLVKVASSGISKIAEVIGKIAGFFGGEQTEKRHESRKNNPDAVGLGASRLQGYARGGFANKPSIFGEAGLEAAIPISPGNPRSVMLLQKTAELLGVGDMVAPMGRGQSLTLHYNPIITGVPTEQLQPMLKQHVQDIAAILDERANMQRRLSFGTA